MSDIADVLEGRAQWCVIEGDCLEVMATMGDKSVDHVITDPPYAARAMKNARGNGETMKQRREGVVYDFNYAALTVELRESAAAHFSRLVRRWCLTWCDLESAMDWRAALAPLEYIRTGIWHRENPAPQFSGDRPGQAVEACVITHPSGRKRWNGGGHSAFWSGLIVNSQDDSRAHSTPKPLWLMLEQVEQFTDPDEVILDSFAGSGTTGVACLRLGRRFIGIERDPKYAAIAHERLAAEDRGLTLRDSRAGQTSIFDVLGPEGQP